MSSTSQMQCRPPGQTPARVKGLSESWVPPVVSKWEMGNNFPLGLRDFCNPRVLPASLVPASLSKATAYVIKG